MGKDEFYSLDQLYAKHKGDKDVKTLISEGAIKVFREANQIKFKPAQESQQETAMKAKSSLLEKKERQFYSLSCKKSQQECSIILGTSVFLSAFILLFYGFFLKNDTASLWLDIALFSMALAQVSLLFSLAMSLHAYILLGRFEILNIQEMRTKDKKSLLALFNKGYSYKQGTKILFFLGIAGIIQFLFFYVAHTNIMLGLFILSAIAGIFYWAYIYLKMLQKQGMVHAQHKNFLLAEEEISDILGGETKGEIEEKIALSGLQAILQSNSVKVRKNAVKALGKLCTQESIYLLTKNLGDISPDIRAQVASVLGKSGEKSVHEALKCLLNDDASEVRVAAADALGNLKDETSIDVLIDALDDSCPEVRGAACEALGNLKKKKTVKALVSQMRDRDWFVRHKVILGLGKIKEELSMDAIEKLIQSMEDENEYVSNAARHVLKKIFADISPEDPIYQNISESLEKEIPKKNKRAEIQEDRTNIKKEEIFEQKEELASQKAEENREIQDKNIPD